MTSIEIEASDVDIAVVGENFNLLLDGGIVSIKLPRIEIERLGDQIHDHLDAWEQFYG